MSRSEQSVRFLLAFILIAFSSQGQTSLLQAMAGYLVAGVLLGTSLSGRCVIYKLLGWR
ncbi:YgaP family membrane protein [Nitrospira sp. Kam-Ns4a]